MFLIQKVIFTKYILKHLHFQRALCNEYFTEIILLKHSSKAHLLPSHCCTVVYLVLQVVPSCIQVVVCTVTPLDNHHPKSQVMVIVSFGETESKSTDECSGGVNEEHSRAEMKKNA